MESTERQLAEWTYLRKTVKYGGRCGILILYDFVGFRVEPCLVLCFRVCFYPVWYFDHLALGKRQLSILAASWQNRQNGMCAQRRLRSAKAWVLSLPFSALQRPWSAGRMPRLIGVFAGRTCCFFRFVTMRLIWTTSSEFGTYRLCGQRRFRRACASAQSRQNLRCSLIQALSQEEPSDRKPDP